MAQVPIVGSRKVKKAAARLRTPTPQSLLIALREQYWTRFHMFLIVAASMSMALLTTRLMLRAGVTEMWARYAVALSLAYGTFFVGVWVWLHLSQYGRHLRADWGRKRDWAPDAGLDILPNINVGGGVGSASPAEMPFQGGGGAAGSWDVPHASVSVDLPGSGLLDGVGDVGDGGDEGGGLLIIARAARSVALHRFKILIVRRGRYVCDRGSSGHCPRQVQNWPSRRPTSPCGSSRAGA